MTLEEAILTALSEKTGIPTEEIKTVTRKREIVTCRQIGYYLYRVVYKSPVSLKRTSKMLFNLKQDHSTILHSIEQTETHIKYERDIRMLTADVKDRVDELLFEPERTKPINQVMKEVSEHLNSIIQVIPYNNCASF